MAKSATKTRSSKSDRLLRELADLVRRVAEASGQRWEYACVVINVGDELPRLQPVVVTPEGGRS